MNVPETCSALSLVWVLQWFLLAEVLLCGISCQERHGGSFCARTPGLPLANLWAWPGLPLPCLVVDLATSALCCVFVMCSGKLRVCCQGRHKSIKPGGCAQFLAALSAVAAGHQ